jgi:tetratricopeptide (TPR) repeat protein
MLFACPLVSFLAGLSFADPPFESSAQRKSDDALVSEHRISAIPSPDLTAMDEAVQRQLREAQSRVAATQHKSGANQREVADAWGFLGQLYQAYGLDPAASSCYLIAQRLDPGEFKWPYYLGLLHRNQGEIQQAAAYFEAALNVRPSNEPALLRLAEAKLELNQREEAKSLYKRVLARDKSSVPALVGLGKAALAERKFAVAVECFNQVLRIDPQAS